MLEKFFRISENKTTIRTEVLAGLTTFMTMAYILAVNPSILSATGMDKNALFTATALASLAATLVMALYAKLPFALAPGMGLNAFFAFTVVLGMGHSWQFALTAVFIEGIIFILLTAFNIRELIVNSIPMNMKHAVSAGIGLFIAFIGLQNAGIIVNNDAVLLGLGSVKSPAVIVALSGIIITGVLLAKNVKGALLIGIFAATIIGLPLGVTMIPKGHLVSLPPSLSPIFMKLEFHEIFTADMLVVVFTFLFVDMFDTVGTLVGVSDKAGMLSKDGKIPNAKQALFADAIGTTFGAMLGTSTVTTYVESASGVAEGGRTGLTSLSVAGLFLLALFFAPLFLMIPAAATAPVLFLVGLFMMSPILKINLNDFTEAIPAFFTIIMMPLSYSIAEGIVFGMLSYVLLKLLTGKYREVTPVMYVLAVLFVLSFFTK
ncbi:NCS2 family permease [Lentimicrobium sp.]|jgi:AGZA family xanthine/uracil permease-like MFS transporter|uniref:NCS2 family permease n=1 Tax=Lentimicrobium sp. TaxID=2034841 RepID=UPI0025FD5387|nr:NCS2 family permease [Lentimicrobium sp.]MCO5256031.1 NCS2 family permease [Lentimicrobium sp.]HPF65843.1 NCS2 family permease [Lentimicrobium sp.]HPJ61256.1 NCS2 family permease [Lentimicrobium sp.]HPR26688.1 NCS2 family permease [Lentimicrobium sp.]HRW70531.1 NCS2 family permease [Lentimicrobium sp.]